MTRERRLRGKVSSVGWGGDGHVEVKTTLWRDDGLSLGTAVEVVWQEPEKECCGYWRRVGERDGWGHPLVYCATCGEKLEE